MHVGDRGLSIRGSATISPQQYFLRLANRVVCPGDTAEFDPQIFYGTETVEFFYG
jgi:hypothetical protein